MSYRREHSSGTLHMTIQRVELSRTGECLESTKMRSFPVFCPDSKTSYSQSGAQFEYIDRMRRTKGCLRRRWMWPRRNPAKYICYDINQKAGKQILSPYRIGLQVTYPIFLPSRSSITSCGIINFHVASVGDVLQSDWAYDLAVIVLLHFVTQLIDIWNAILGLRSVDSPPTKDISILGGPTSAPKSARYNNQFQGLWTGQEDSIILMANLLFPPKSLVFTRSHYV